MSPMEAVEPEASKLWVDSRPSILLLFLIFREVLA